MELVGRSSELRRLTDALFDPDVELVVLQGAAGAGKTALAEAALQAVEARGVLVGRGKYPEGLPAGFSPILLALTEVVGKALELLYDPAAGARDLAEKLGPQISVLEQAGFGPVGVITPQRTLTPAALGNEGAVRVIDAIARLLRWLQGFNAPIVLFIDDWHRAPREAQPFSAIAARGRTSGLVSILLSQREAPHRQYAATRALTLEIGELTQSESMRLIDHALGAPGCGTAIMDWLGRSTSALPLDLIESARALRDAGALVQTDGAWTVAPSRAATVERDDVMAALMRRIRNLGPAVRETGMALAIWGDRCEISLLADALDMPPDVVRANLERLAEEWIIVVRGTKAAFIHDRFRLGLINAARRLIAPQFLADIADRIIAMGGPRRIALQFRLEAGLDQAPREIWRDRFVEEAILARQNGDRLAAGACAEAAFALWDAAGVGRGDFALLREAAMAAASRNDMPSLRSRMSEMFKRAEHPDDISLAYQTGAVAASLAGDGDLAWTWSVEGLGRLGVRLPAAARMRNILAAAVSWSVGRLLPQPPPPPGETADAADPVSRILHFAAVVAYMRDPRMMLLVSLLGATRARRLGYRSTLLRSVDIVLFASFGMPRAAARLAERLFAEWRISGFGQAATFYRIVYMGLIWAKPLSALRDSFAQVYDLAIAEGDLVYSGQALRNSVQFAWRIEPTLTGVAAIVRETAERAEQTGDAVALEGMRVFAEMIDVFQDPSGFAGSLDNAPWTRLGATAGAGAPTIWMETLGLRGDWTGALALANKFDHCRPALNPHPGGVIWRFHENLARLKMGLPIRRGDLRYIRRAAEMNSVDHERKLMVLKAEDLRRRGRATPCLEAYARAVTLAMNGLSRLEAGLAAECAAAAARGFGKPELADRYDKVARDTWRSWGMHAKLGPTHETVRDAGMNQSKVAELEQRTVLAERSDRSKSRFLAEVGHELRTPMQAIQALLDLSSEAKAPESVQSIREAFGSLKMVVDDLTDLAAIDAGAPLHFKPTDLGRLVASECRLIAASAMGKNLEVIVETPTTPALVQTDGARVSQILRNLLSNAVKFTSAGTIKVALSITPDAQTPTRRRILLAVSDTGSGLSEAASLRLFEPFERGEREDGGGLGLGLAISRRIAVRLGGTLTAANNIGSGATFVLVFDADIAPDRPASAQPDEVDRLSILIVEDVDLNRRLLTRLLTKMGHEVTEARDGACALRAARERSFDLLLLDLGLPDMDGIELLGLMREAGRAPARMTAALTATSNPETRERALRAGADCFLTKPVTADELREILADLSRRPPDDPAFDEAGRELDQEARIQILDKIRMLTARSEQPAARAATAHWLAGLAAQFGYPEIAAAADALDQDIRANRADSVALVALRHAAASMESARRGAS